MSANWIGKRASARWAYPHNLSHVRAEGMVIAYSATPMVLIETDDGERVWWGAELTVPMEAAGAPESAASIPVDPSPTDDLNGPVRGAHEPEETL